MKGASKRVRVASVAILVGALASALSFWFIRGNDARKFDRLKENALCVLDLPEGDSSVSTTLTIARPADMFHVAVRTRGSHEPLSISISGDQGLVGSASVAKAGSFGLGRGIRPGTYTVTLAHEADGNGGVTVICGEQPVYVTGWQILSRTYLGLLVLSGICVLLLRNAKDAKKRAWSVSAFQALLLGFVVVFIYLLFHEGGHALAEITFGRFDLARSDFWGIHGHPHSGGTIGPALKPWQQELISCAGPMLPTLAGFALFLLWSLPARRKLRGSRPVVNLYFSAVVAMLVIPEAIVGPAYLLSIITAEADLIDYVAHAGGPVWLTKGLLVASSLFSAIILWRVVPELLRAWKAQFLQPWKPIPHPTLG